MASGDGDVVLPVHTVWDHGADAEKYTIIITGEGFLETELTEFIVAARSFAHHLKSMAPFDEMHCAVNIHILEAYSNASLPLDANDCGTYPYAAGASPHNTYYGAQFCYGGVDRAMTVNESWTKWVIEDFVTTAYDAILVIVKHDADGGGNSGNVAITTLNGDWMSRAIHELGHILELADEYPFFAGCDVDGSAYESFTGTEPVYQNVTADPSAKPKWWEMIDTPGPAGQPTLRNPNCHGCDYPWTGPTPAPPAKCAPGSTEFGEEHIGTFEGANYHHCDVYRPQYDCMMRTGAAGFCAVCREHIRSMLRTWMPACLAPTFPPATGLAADWKVFRLLLWNLILSLSIAASARCRIRKNWFMIKNIKKGNTNPCIDLPDPP